MIDRTKFALFLLVSIAMAFPARADNKPKPPSNTIRAQRTVHIECADSEQRAGAIEAISLTSVQQAFLQNVAQTVGSVVGLPANQVTETVAIDFEERTGNVILTVDLSKVPNGAKARAAEAANAAVNALERALDRTPLRAQYEDARNSFELIWVKHRDNQDELQRARAQLAEKTGAVDVSPSTLRQLLSSLQTQREAVQIDLAAKEARRDALAEQIADFSKQIEVKIKEDPIAAELSKVVALREHEFELRKSQQANGAVTQSEVESASIAIAEAKAKLLERRESAATAAGGDTLSSWNKELMTLSVDLAELRARGKTIDERLKRFDGADSLISRLDEYQLGLADQSKQLSDMQRHVSELEMNYSRHRVSLDTVSSKDDPAPATQPAQ